MGKPEGRVYVYFLLFFLIGMTTFSVFKYASGLKEKYAILNDLNGIKDEVGALNTQKQNLLQTIEKAKKLEQELTKVNLALTDSLKSREEELSRFKENLALRNSDIEELNSQNSLLKSENMALREETDNLAARVATVSQENEELKERLNSIAELKKAIIELKRSSRKISRIEKKEPKTNIEPEGNRGFVVKEGSPTFPPKVRIEVSPVQADNQ